MYKKVKLNVSELLGDDTSPDRQEWITLREVAWLPNERAFELTQLANEVSNQDPNSPDVGSIKRVAQQIMIETVVDWQLFDENDEPVPQPRDLRSRNDGSFEAWISKLPLQILNASQELVFKDTGEVPLERSTSSEATSEPVMLIAEPSNDLESVPISQNG